MVSPLFEYDVFLSFASADAEAAREIWQTLSQGGLRVFWSSETLKQAAGKPFMEAIQASLLQSRHFVLFWTAPAKASGWVQAEYEAFYSQCHLKDKAARRLVVWPDGREPTSSLPPFLRSLQIARSLSELVALLGGVDPQRLEQENRDLRQQADRLRAENAGLQARLAEAERQQTAVADRLRSRLETVERELDQAKRRLAERPTEQAPSTSATQDDSTLPASVGEPRLASIEEALALIEVEEHGSMGSFWVTEKGALATWKKLQAAHGRDVVPGLTSLLENPKHDWQTQWKVITLLSYASRSPDGRDLMGPILRTGGDFVPLGWQVSKAALELIRNAPAPLRLKWEVLFPLLETTPLDKAGELIQSLSELTPADERHRTAAAVADILVFATQPGVTHYAVAALKALNSRGEVSRLREALADAPVAKANVLADLLAHFGDRDAVPAIRQALENWRHGSSSIRGLATSLLAMEGARCHSYLAEVLAESSSPVQRELLSGVLPTSTDSALLAAVAQAANSAPEPNVKDLAEKYLAKTRAG